MDKCFYLTVSTSALRTIDKKGGLDNYLLKTSDENLASQWGSEMKRILQKKLEEKQAFEAKESKASLSPKKK
ncbi:hypothetical protein DSO57_1023429 [Entomophthora muscae]|uniref:Uncharacterized protein n=1 Tax=Entomophthora muscae TaxID=34485 RepID=A0ACC2UCD4_9FUNG|nr:hypothetical protein DSO57_1023429 [Entomophthora muscae]